MSGTQRPSGSETSADGDPRIGFLAFVAHEVRNPLSTALWSAELLTRLGPEERGGARGEKLTAMCLRSLNRVRQLVEDHFLCERLDAQGIPLHVEPVSLQDSLAEVVGRRPDGGPVEVDVEPTLKVAADRVLLDRALDALVAVAGGDGAPVRITARTDGDAAVLAVGGNVPGPEALADPRKGTQGDPKGRALALPMARRVARALGGQLAIEEGALALRLPRPSPEPDQPDTSAHP